MTGNPVSWFGIHAADLDRAKKFYETVFGETLQEVGGGGMRFMIFGADWAKYGVSGMLWSDGGAVPGGVRAPVAGVEQVGAGEDGVTQVSVGGVHPGVHHGHDDAPARQASGLGEPQLGDSRGRLVDQVLDAGDALGAGRAGLGRGLGRGLGGGYHALARRGPLPAWERPLPQACGLPRHRLARHSLPRSCALVGVRRRGLGGGVRSGVVRGGWGERGGQEGAGQDQYPGAQGRQEADPPVPGAGPRARGHYLEVVVRAARTRGGTGVIPLSALAVRAARTRV